MIITDSVFTKLSYQMTGNQVPTFTKEKLDDLEEKIKVAVVESSRIMKEKGLQVFEDRKKPIEYENTILGTTEGDWNWDYKKVLTGGPLFNHEPGFIVRTAQAYLKDPSAVDYVASENGSKSSSEFTLFSYEAMDYFISPDASIEDRNSWKELREQMKAAVQELAEQIASGGGTDLSNLKTKLTVAGVEFSVKEFSQTVDALTQISDPLKKTPGTMDLDQFARLGIACSQVNRYAKVNLNEEQAKLVTGAYQRRAQNHIDNADSYAMTLEEKLKKLGITNLDPRFELFYSTAPDLKSEGTVRGAAFKLFSSLDVSSESAFQSSFRQALGTYAGYLKGVNEHFLPTPTEYQDAMATFYRIKIQEDGSIQVNKPINSYA